MRLVNSTRFSSISTRQSSNTKSHRIAREVWREDDEDAEVRHEAFGVYDELFSYVCPKFITPSAPSFEEPLVNYNQDAYRLQLKMFLYEVKQQQLLSGVRTFLKVYSSISLGKLANYMEVDEPTLRTILLTYKHKSHSVGSDGKIISNADIDFDINDDMMDFVETKPTKQYGDFFLRQIAKLDGVINDMDRIKLE
ncbi:hypothetical protein F2Q68_00012260 [Brassica cretica]|uniref:PCI domain-containing protein n=1 Tax=Brassica cretica TaxID=69181 RepID=A0A8S9KW15_BRACR|nr:hypothetical protein F2Q68_00012260 [Brassica cretica]